METIPSAVAELCSDGKDPAWFCIRSQLKREHIAAAQLRLLPEVEVFNPQLRLLRLTRRGRVWSTESLFPNYLFARFVLDAKLERVRYTPSVKMVVQFGDVVPTIPDAVIQELRRGLETMKNKVLTDAPEVGEEIEVASGAFKGVSGRVAHVLPAKQRVQILLDLMGRSIAAELSLELVLFRKKDAAKWVLEGTALASVLGPALQPERRASPEGKQTFALAQKPRASYDKSGDTHGEITHGPPPRWPA